MSDKNLLKKKRSKILKKKPSRKSLKSLKSSKNGKSESSVVGKDLRKKALNLIRRKDDVFKMYNEDSTSKSGKSKKGDFHTEITNEVNENVIVKKISEICGAGCGTIVGSVFQFIAIILRLNKKNDFPAKLQRIIMLTTTFLGLIISFTIIIFNIVAEVEYMNGSKSVNGTQADSELSGVFDLRRNQVILYNNICCIIVYLIMTFLTLIFYQLEVVWFNVVVLMAFEQIDVVHIFVNCGILSGNTLGYTTLVILTVIFALNSTILQVGWFIVYTVNFVAFFVLEIVFENAYRDNLNIILKDEFIITVFTAYVVLFLPTYLLVVVYFLRTYPQMWFLRKVVVKQKKLVDRFEEIGEEFDEILAEKRYKDNSSIAHLKINKKLFEIPYEDLKIIEKIGSGGSSSVVFKAEWNEIEIAFKCFIINEFLEQNKFSEFEREVEILASFCITIFWSDFAPTENWNYYGDIKDFLRKYELKNNEMIGLGERLRWLLEISSALQYVHRVNIIHRDLKLENVLLTKGLESKLMDFGLSKVIEDMSETKTQRVGTASYMAPEVVRGENYTFKCDCYSFGILIFVMITGKFHPYGENENVEFKVANNSSFRSHFPEERPEFGDIFSVLKEKIKDSIVTKLEKKIEKEPVRKALSIDVVKTEKEIIEDQTTELDDLRDIIGDQKKEILRLKQIVDILKQDGGENSKKKKRGSRFAFFFKN